MCRCGSLLDWQSKSVCSCLDVHLLFGQIANALISAHKRGVEVRVVFDKSQSYSQFAVLKAAGIEVKNDTNWEGIMHDKVAIIDSRIILAGSFNWTDTAENNNNENLIVIHSVEVAARYESEFQKIWSQSQG
jgi:phosphatidylserine/phosphatidylglycerophosphate/cardiolipin synthase-like enzyme